MIKNTVSVILAMLSILIAVSLACADTQFTIHLDKDWNFVSVPVQPTDTSANSVLKDIAAYVRVVWGYDNQTKTWKKWRPNSAAALSTIESGKGYWIYMDASADLVVQGSDVSPTMTLAYGWNLVGYNGNDASINTALDSLDWDIAWGWENGIWSAQKTKYVNVAFSVPDLTSVSRGKAYWIKTASPYNIQPLKPGITIPEAVSITAAPGSTVRLGLSDGTALDLPSTSSAVSVTLGRKTNTVSSEAVEFGISGSMRELTLSSSGAIPKDYTATLVLPASEYGTINPATINVVRIADMVQNGQVVKGAAIFLPVQRTATGDLQVTDSYISNSFSAAGGSLSGVIAPQKIKTGESSVSIQYVIATFQGEEVNWLRKPALVRMALWPASSNRRVPFSTLSAADQEKELMKCSKNIVVLVHGHNETEGLGFHYMSTSVERGKHSAPQPWEFDYKRDVWTIFYDQYMSSLADNPSANNSACTVFYEYIYPSFRPIYLGRGNLGSEFAQLLANEIQPLIDAQGNPNLFIVAHSMGGLVSRAAIQQFSPEMHTAFQKLVTWGSPHHGSVLSTLRYIFAGPYESTSYDPGSLAGNIEFVKDIAAGLVLDTPGARDLRCDTSSCAPLLSTYYQRSPAFGLEEFVGQYSIVNLCGGLKMLRLIPDFYACRNLEELNSVLTLRDASENPALYSAMLDNKANPSSNIVFLKQKYDSFPYDHNLRLLQRSIMEELLPQETPPMESSVAEKLYSLYDGTWPYNDNTRILNANDYYRSSDAPHNLLDKKKYTFIYGQMDSCLYGQICWGGKATSFLTNDAPSDGAVPFMSMTASGIDGYSVLVGPNINHEEYFGSPVTGSDPVTFPQTDKAIVASKATLAQLQLNDVSYNCTPTITNVTPNPAKAGDSITIKGVMFGRDNAENKLYLGGVLLTWTSWNDTTITFIVPSTQTIGGKLKLVTGAGLTSNEVDLIISNPKCVNLNLDMTDVMSWNQATIHSTGTGTICGPSDKYWTVQTYDNYSGGKRIEINYSAYGAATLTPFEIKLDATISATKSYAAPCPAAITTLSATGWCTVSNITNYVATDMGTPEIGIYYGTAYNVVTLKGSSINLTVNPGSKLTASVGAAFGYINQYYSKGAGDTYTLSTSYGSGLSTPLVFSRFLVINIQN